MGNKKWKDEYFQKVIKTNKPRERTRSTVFEDDVTKADLRQNRRQNEKKEIEIALEEELEVLEEVDLDEISYPDNEEYKEGF